MMREVILLNNGNANLLVPKSEVLSVWRYTHCTYVQYVLVRYKYACYSQPLIIIRDGPS